MQLPALIVLVVIVLGAFYVKIAKIPVSNGQPISWPTPITILIIVGLYFWGRFFESKSDNGL